ncbi:hypothetical protein INT45_013181 [Circinella minor]|uniref:Uncharacterized protein n=1 Tax=Circinella minor TaxID=1195481 RepID=A0A8H7VGW2_9FUNG|nr:hypothetical protein INT45_013181 [Circinella minor]
MGDLTVASFHNYRNLNSSTPMWTADESSSYGITPGHSRNVTGETSFGNMDFSKMDSYRRGSQQADMTGLFNTIHHDQDGGPETDDSPWQSLVYHNSQTSDKSITNPPSTTGSSVARKEKKTKVSCEPDDIPKWKCMYPECDKKYGRREDLFNKHIFTHHFQNTMEYTCKIGEHKKQTRLVHQPYTATKHFKRCWKTSKHRHRDNETSETPPQGLYSMPKPSKAKFDCGVEGCLYVALNKSKLRDHFWSEHSNFKTDMLPTYTCPYCRGDIKERRSEYIKKHINGCGTKSI